MNNPQLLIDARNIIYRAIYAGHAERKRRPTDTHCHYFVIVLRQISRWINHLRPSSVHVFWDAPRETIWRRKILATYKDRSSSQYVADISEDLKTVTDVATDFFNVMNIRQYSRDRMEADDLLYAVVTMMHPKPTVIVSSDSDMVQIPYAFTSCNVLSPEHCKFVPMPSHSPVFTKALIGDKADCIDGYFNVGPKTCAILLDDPNRLNEFFQVKGSSTFKLNLALIDLSLCPFLLSNKMYVRKTMSQPIIYDAGVVNELIKKHKVVGLHSEFTNLIAPYKSLV